MFALEELSGIPVSGRFLDCPPMSRFDFTSILDYTKLITHVFSRGNSGEAFACLGCIIILGSESEERYGSAITLLMMFITALVEGALCVILAPEAMGGGFSLAFMMIILWGLSFFSEKRIPLVWLFLAAAFIVAEGAFLRAAAPDETLTDYALCVLLKLIAAVTGSFIGLFTAPRVARRTGAGVKGQAGRRSRPPGETSAEQAARSAPRSRPKSKERQ